MKMKIPFALLLWPLLAAARRTPLIPAMEPLCFYSGDDSVILLKQGPPGAPVDEVQQAAYFHQHVAMAQRAHDKSTPGPNCTGLSRELHLDPSSNIYHGCFSPDALDAIERHPDTYLVIRGIKRCHKPPKIHLGPKDTVHRMKCVMRRGIKRCHGSWVKKPVRDYWEFSIHNGKRRARLNIAIRQYVGFRPM